MKYHWLIVLTVPLFVFPVFGQSEVDEFIKKSREYELQFKYPEAISEITNAIEIQPGNAALYLRRADIYFSIKEFERIEEDVKAAVQFAPNDEQTISIGSRLLRISGKCAESLTVLNNYLNNNQPTGFLLYYRTFTKICLEDWIGALEDISKAAELEPHSNHFKIKVLEIMREIGQTEKSLDILNRMIKIYTNKLEKTADDNEKAGLRYELAELYTARFGYAGGNRDAGLADLKKAIEFDPKDYRYEFRGHVFYSFDMFDEAIADYTKALEITEDLKKGGLLIERGNAFIELGKFDEAIRDYQEALNVKGANKEVIEKGIVWIRQLQKKKLRN